MSMYFREIRSKRELEELVRSCRAVLVEFRDHTTFEGRYFTRVLESLASVIAHDIELAYIDVTKRRELASNVDRTPALRLYVEGRVVWEQEGCLLNEEADKMAIRRGIRDTSKKLGLRLRV